MTGFVSEQMMWDGDNHMGGGWWWAMGIGWLVCLLLIAVLGYLLFRHLTRPGTDGQGRGTAEDVLVERFARGEIDEDEYRRRRATLRG